jgi:hypothetical protein
MGARPAKDQQLVAANDLQFGANTSVGRPSRLVLILCSVSLLIFIAIVTYAAAAKMQAPRPVCPLAFSKNSWRSRDNLEIPCLR